MNDGHCIVCGEPLTVNGVKDHHCDPKRESHIEAGRKAAEEENRPRTPSYRERLADGFEMLQASDS